MNRIEVSVKLRNCTLRFVGASIAFINFLKGPDPKKLKCTGKERKSACPSLSAPSLEYNTSHLGVCRLE